MEEQHPESLNPVVFCCVTLAHASHTARTPHTPYIPRLMIRGALLAASVAAALRLPAPATAQQQPFWPGGYQQSFPGAVCKASCAGPPPTSVIGFNKPITLYGYTQVGAPGDVPGDVGCDSPLSQVICQGERGDGQRPGGRSVYRCRPSVCNCAYTHTRSPPRSHCIRPSARMLFVEEVVTRVLDSVVLTPAIYRTHVLVIGTDRTYARVMPLDHSCVLYTAVLWSLAFTHVNTRAHAFLAPAPPRLFARIIQRTRTSRRNFSAPRARSPRRAACPPTRVTKTCRTWHSAARRAQAWHSKASMGGLMMNF